MNIVMCNWKSVVLIIVQHKFNKSFGIVLLNWIVSVKLLKLSKILSQIASSGNGKVDTSVIETCMLTNSSFVLLIHNIIEIAKSKSFQVFSWFNLTTLFKGIFLWDYYTFGSIILLSGNEEDCSRQKQWKTSVKVLCGMMNIGNRLHYFNLLFMWNVLICIICVW